MTAIALATLASFVSRSSQGRTVRGLKTLPYNCKIYGLGVATPGAWQAEVITRL